MLRNKRKEKKSKKQRWNLPASEPMRYAYFRVPEASARPGMRSSAAEGSASGSTGGIFNDRLGGGGAGGGGGREWRSSAAAAELKQREGKQCLSAAAPSRQRHPSPIRRTDDFTKA